MLTPVAPPRDAPARAVTFEEFLVLYTGQHAEWHPDGSVEIVVSNNIFHIRMVTFLVHLLDIYLRLTRQAQVIPAAFTQKIPDQSAREPDIMIVLNEHLDRIKDTFLDGPADIAIEVVSPESVERDYEHKFREYAAGGVREYWIIDIERRVFDIHELDADGRYMRRYPDAEQCIASGLLADFALDAALLWNDPLPEGEDLIALAANLAGLDVRLTPKPSAKR